MQVVFSRFRPVFVYSVLTAFFALNLVPVSTQMPSAVVLLTALGVCLAIAVMPGYESNSLKQNSRFLIFSVLLFFLSYSLAAIHPLDEPRVLLAAKVWFPACIIGFLMMAGFAQVVMLSLVAGALLGLLGLLAMLHLHGAYAVSESSAEVLQGLSSPFLVVPNDLLFFALVFPFLMFLLPYRGTGLRRSRQFVEGLYLCCLVLLSAWAGSLSLVLVTGFLAAIFLMGVRPVVNVIQSVPFTLLLPIVLVWLAYLFKQEIDQFIATETRLWLWTVSWQSLSASEQFYSGVGPGNFDIFFSEARHSKAAPSGFAEDPRRMGWAHNLFLESWIERGVAGFVSTLLVFLSILVGYVRLANENNEFLLPVVAFLLFVLVACMELSFIRPWVSILLAIHFGFVLTADAHVKPPVKASERRDST